MRKKIILFLSIVIIFSIAGMVIYTQKSQKLKKTEFPTQNGQASTTNLSTKTDPNESKKTALLRIQTSGGLCPNGACYGEIVIFSDGSYTDSPENNKKYQGVISTARINMLREEIKKADFASIKAAKFTELCPTAYDGAEITYVFVPQNETIPSCSYKINTSSPPFNTIQDILEDIYNQRT